VNEVGSGFGLEYHQDWPSMVSSLNSVVAWTAVTEVGPDTHGLEFLVSSHKAGVLPGEQTENGWIIDHKITLEYDSFIPVLPKGGLIIFSPFLVHRTHIAKSYLGYKLAFSQRFDDLHSNEWRERGFQCAYSNFVDRKLFSHFP